MNTDPSISSFPYGSDMGVRVRAALSWLTLLLVVIAVLGWWIEGQARILLFVGLEMFLGWAALAAVIHRLYLHWSVTDREAPVSIPLPFSFAQVGQWMLLFLGLAVVAKISLPGLRFYIAMEQASVASLRLAAVLLLGCAAVLYFFNNYSKIVQGKVGATFITPILQLSQVAYLACAAGSAATFLFLSTQRDVSGYLAWFLIIFTLILALEPLLRQAGRFYLPKSARGTPGPVGASLVLDLLFGSRRSLRSLAGEMEVLLGTRLDDVWILRFLRETAEATILVGVVLGWLSTCFTAVPLGSRGVLVSFGQYGAKPLDPGLHVSWPWPLGEIDLVQTERIREIALGFDQDLSGPTLWTERHYTGEQNLLVGDGESLLTIDVPIQYRVADAIAFLKATTDATAALKSLAERKLIQVAQSRESFGVMTVDRPQMAAEIKQGLQDEVNRLGLGLEIVFVGLKDVHPPVDVAPAYERVVSAQETKEATIDRANAYEATVLPDAHAAAQRLVVEADASATKRVDQATGEAARFSALVAAEHDNPALFRTRLKYDALDEGLLAPAKIVVGLSGQDLPSTYLDLRGRKDSFTPAPVQQAEDHPAPTRETPKEAPER